MLFFTKKKSIDVSKEIIAHIQDQNKTAFSDLKVSIKSIKLIAANSGSYGGIIFSVNTPKFKGYIEICKTKRDDTFTVFAAIKMENKWDVTKSFTKVKSVEIYNTIRKFA